MLLGARQLFWLNTKKALPYDAEIEYLESTGTQYIDTGIVCAATDEMSIEVFVNSDDSHGAWTYCGAAGEARVWDTSGTCRFGGENYSNINRVVRLGEWNTITSNQHVVSVNGTDIPTTLGQFQGESKLSLWLFRANGMPSTIPPSLKIASFSLKRIGQLLIDLVPVRVGSVGYMYDKVSGTLFGNSGTGDFVLGRDINPK